MSNFVRKLLKRKTKSPPILIGGLLGIFRISYLTASLKTLPALNFGLIDAAI